MTRRTLSDRPSDPRRKAACHDARIPPPSQTTRQRCSNERLRTTSTGAGSGSPSPTSTPTPASPTTRPSTRPGATSESSRRSMVRPWGSSGRSSCPAAGVRLRRRRDPRGQRVGRRALPGPGDRAAADTADDRRGARARPRLALTVGGAGQSGRTPLLLRGLRPGRRPGGRRSHGPGTGPPAAPIGDAGHEHAMDGRFPQVGWNRSAPRLPCTARPVRDTDGQAMTRGCLRRCAPCGQASTAPWGWIGR